MDTKVTEFLNEVFKALGTLSSCPIRIYDAGSIETLKVEIWVDRLLLLKTLGNFCKFENVELSSVGSTILITVYSADHLPF